MSTTTLIKTAIGTVIAVLVCGCAAIDPYSYPSGSLYTGGNIPHYMIEHEASGAGKSGDKVGESCTTAILHAVAFGDASLDAAKKAAGITDIHTVEMRGMSIMGVYQQACTEVHGK